jgi:TPR repeat protein/Zn-dependent protease with chaperone function
MQAAPCDVAWDGDKVVAAIAGRPGYLSVPLRDRQQRVTPVTVAQIQAFNEAREKIGRVAGLSPHFVICGDGAPNAFAAKTNSGDVVGVTVGMMRLADGDSDMAAAVIGHEFAHHKHGHAEAGAARDAVLGIAGAVLGAVIDIKSQRRTGVATNVGQTLGSLGAQLISRKFDRDQERDADETGFTYLVDAGFNPLGTVHLAERMNRAGLGGVGLFFDSHPGWEERTERFRTLIAASPDAQRLVASNAARQAPQPTATAKHESAPEIAATYTTSDAQKSYNDGLAAWRAGDATTAAREFRASAATGYAPAQTALGILYLSGYSAGGIPKDPNEAVRLYKLAADQGNAQAQANLGHAYLVGAGGLAKDESEGVRLFRLAAEQGNGTGQANLGYAYLQGLGGLTKDPSEAVRLYRLSAAQGNSVGQANLGLAYIRGTGGLEVNPVEAVRLFQLSAARGNAIGQNNLGYCYENGVGGLSRDVEQAVAWYRKAAAQGVAQSMASLKRLGR